MLDEGKVGDDGKILVVVLGSDEDIVACGMSGEGRFGKEKKPTIK